MMNILNNEPALDRLFIPSMAARRPVLAARKVRVLMLEDRASDAELNLRQLRRFGFDPDWQRVETKEQFVAHLDPKIDIILADYNVPHFDGLTALRCLRQSGLDIPFILLSGPLADEMAAQCVKQGVTDYLLKDRLERLGLAVSNALAEKRLRVERKLVDEQLRQAQKMEAIGQLTGGIAHDFNNVLSVINGYVSLLLDGEALPPGALKALKQVQLAGERGAGLTQQLLFFSRKRPTRRQSVDLNAIVNAMATLLRRLIGEPISLELNLSPELRVIEADVSMMEQILMNLVVNARDAMTTGHVVIDTRMVALTETNVRGRANARAGSFVSLSVRDEGRGIPPEVLSRIFEPFFTTKDVGKGTGLGLTTVLGIVQEHRGWVEVDSTIGSGTTFKIFLPVACAEVQPLLESEGDQRKVAGGRETILVVEDDATVREFTVAVLKPYGYNVLQARSGVDALEVWSRYSGAIDLLLTDIVMPDGMTGPELATRLQAGKPDLPVIFTSGYGQKMMAQVLGSRNVARFVHKPCAPRTLAKAIREILDASAA